MLVAELKANSRKGESPKEKSPGRKEPALERPSQEPPSGQVVAAAAAPSSTFSARAKQTYSYCALPRYGPGSSPHPHLGTLGCKPSGTPGDRPRESPRRCCSLAPSVWGDLGTLAGVEIGDSLFLTKHATVP